MQCIVGTDHGGFVFKELLVKWLTAQGHVVDDRGVHDEAPVDYPLIAADVARAVAANQVARGILLCRSGEGMEMAANKIPGIRAALVWEPHVAVETRRDNDANILCLPADFITEKHMYAIVDAFLATPFSGEERHARRIHQLMNLENER